MPHTYQISNIKYQRTFVRACVGVFDFALCKEHMQCISFDTFNSFSHSANPNIIHTVGITLAQVDFCTLANNASCSSKREHKTHKNDTK